MPRIRYAGKTDIGLKRSNNEDSLVIEPALGLMVVADGMGGAASGEVASGIFAESAREVFAGFETKSDESASAFVQKAFSQANERIFATARENRQHSGMGCTAELLVLYDNSYIIGHVGDSRSYLLRQKKMRQITRDHSLIQEQIEEGIISPQEARTHVLRNVIIRAVGVRETLPVDLIKGPTQSRDIFLLCSDGLTDMLEDAAIEELLSRSLDIEKKAQKLIDAANAAGGYDNITVALCEIS